MAYKGGKLPDGTPLNVAVYKAYRNAGLSHNQALAITAEVGRENSFSAGTLFGNHTDPAANGKGKSIRNLGMLSWNQGRDVNLERYLNQQGVMSGGRMARTQANLNAQAKFSVGEMRSPRYASKLKNFWSNPNSSPDSYAKELGRSYVVWAYGQDTIKAQGGGRKPFNWKAHDGYRRGYLNTLNGMLGGKERYTPQQGESYQAEQPFQLTPRRPLSELLAENRPTPAPFRLPERRPLSELLAANKPAPEPFVLPARRPLAEILKENSLTLDGNDVQPQQAPPTIDNVIEPPFVLPERRPLSELLAANAIVEQPNAMLEPDTQEWLN